MLIKMRGNLGGTLVSQSTVGSLTAYCSTYFNGSHVVGGATNKLFTSTDGTAWTSQTISDSPQSFVASNSYLVAGGYRYILRSSDLATWTQEYDIGASGYPFWSSFNDGTYLGCMAYTVLDNGYTRYSSNDGDTWSGSGTNGYIAEAYGNSVYVSMYTYEEDLFLIGLVTRVRLYKSTTYNRTDATYVCFIGTVDDTIPARYYFVLFCGGYFFARANAPALTGGMASNQVYISQNGSSWTKTTIGSGQIRYAFFDERIRVGGAASWFVCGDNGMLYYSHDRTSWVNYSVSTTDDFISMHTDGSSLFLVSSQGNLWRLVQ